MNTYYAFAASKYSDIQAAINAKQGEGFFAFTNNFKAVSSGIPQSNLIPNPLPLSVVILETDFAAEDEALRIMAEAEAMYYTTDNAAMLTWLSTTDNELQ